MWDNLINETIDMTNRVSDDFKGEFSAKDGAPVGIFDWSFQKNCPEILDGHFVMPKYVAQNFLERVPRRIPLNYRDSWPSLFIGRDGGYGGNHRDAFGSAFWMYVMEGAKEWHIVDPPERVDFFKNPDTLIRHYHDIVQAGELLIVPANRWHQVRNVGKT